LIGEIGAVETNRKENALTQGSHGDILNSYILLIFSPKGEWADPGGTAIPGQPVVRAEQAPNFSPSTKNQFNIEVPQWGTYQILS